jgi:hypothetical protein
MLRTYPPGFPLLCPFGAALDSMGVYLEKNSLVVSYKDNDFAGGGNTLRSLTQPLIE